MGAINLSAPEIYIEDTPLNLADIVIDNSVTATATLTLSDAAAGALTTGTSGVVTSTYDSATGIWSASGPIADVNALLAAVTFTPAENFNGSFVIATSVSDDAGTATGSKLITGIAVNDAPVAVDDSYTTTEDTALTVAAPGILGNDTDVDGDPLTASVVSAPANGTVTLDIATGAFVYTPAANFNGTDSFTYQANDGTANSNVATVTLTVSPVNDAPVVADDSYTTTENTALTVPAGGILANDTDVDGDALIVSLVSGPANGTVTLDTATGAFVYTPDANFNGTDSFTYQANDGTANSNVATVTLTVNDAPVAANDSYTFNEDTALTVPAPGILGNDTDVNGDVLTASVVSAPANGTVTLDVATGAFVYTPAANFNGTDIFTYQANDGTANSNVAIVTLTVIPVNDAPVAADDSYTTTENTALTVPAGGILANDSDVDGDVLTASVLTAPAHGTVALNADGAFTYTPAANFNGTDSFTYQANDGTANSNVATVTLTVSPTLQADLAITKTDGVTTVVPGGNTTYTIVVSNPGLSAVTGASVSDPLPAGVTGATWATMGITGGGSVSGPASGTGALATTVDLPVNATVTFTFTTTEINPSATGSFANTATVTPPAGVTDPDPTNNSATDTDTLTPEADLAITKTDGVTTVVPGGSTIYTIVVTNNGLSTAVGAGVTDLFPPFITVPSWTAVASSGSSVAQAIGAGNILTTVTLLPGGTATFTAVAQINPLATGLLTNTVTVSPPAGGTDPDQTNNSATDTDTITIPAPSIQVVKFVNGQDADSPTGPHVAVGSTVTFTYVVTDTGNVPLANVVVMDDKLGPITTFTGDFNSNGQLDLTETWTYTATATALAGQQTNVGTVTAVDPNNPVAPVSDANPANYFGDAPAPAINIVKFVNGQDADSPTGPHVAVGSTVTFTYVVTDTGNVPLANVVVIDDKLGPITTFTGDFNSNGQLDLTETWTYTATATALAGQQTNVGTVTAVDPNTGTPVSDSNPANYFAGTTEFEFPLPIFQLPAFGPSAGGWSSNDTYPRELADVDGGGMADIVGFSQAGVYVSLATGGGHFAAPTFELAAFGTNAGGWSSDNTYPRELADVNGDTRADIIGFSSAGVFESLATTGGHFAAPTFELAAFGTAADAGGWTSQDLYPRTLADVNADGMADIVGFGADGVFVSLATGGGHFASPTFQLPEFGPNAGGWSSDNTYPRQLADITGNGAGDIVGFATNGVWTAPSLPVT